MRIEHTDASGNITGRVIRTVPRSFLDRVKAGAEPVPDMEGATETVDHVPAKVDDGGPYSQSCPAYQIRRIDLPPTAGPAHESLLRAAGFKIGYRGEAWFREEPEGFEPRRIPFRPLPARGRP